MTPAAVSSRSGLPIDPTNTKSPVKMPIGDVGSAAYIGQHERDALGRVTWRMQNFELHVADVELIAIFEELRVVAVGEPILPVVRSCVRQIELRSDPIGQFP